jgi:hypothetical protein
MGEIVNLHGQPAPTKDDFEFVSDLARFREGLLDEKSIRKKFRLADEVWEKLADDDSLIRAVEAESVRRVRDGSAKREKAQALVVKAPDVLSDILLDNSANARHRIDSAKTLNDFAANGPEAATAGTRFEIVINLGSDTLTFNKSIRPIEPGEIDPDDCGPDVDTSVVAAIAAKKSQDGGDGNAI